MDPQLMEHLRSKLLSRREIALARQQRLCAERTDLLAAPGARQKQVNAESTVAARLEGLARLESQTLHRIDASFEKMANGTYGMCSRCHGAIESERLRAMPDVSFCSGCTR